MSATNSLPAAAAIPHGSSNEGGIVAAAALAASHQRADATVAWVDHPDLVVVCVGHVEQILVPHEPQGCWKRA